jgi:uncharacterized protein (TIGR03435 family)
VLSAYRLQESRVAGGPNWIERDRFDVNAKANGDPSRDQVQLMLQALLAMRFGLVVHRETRDLPIYALQRARADGSLGPNLKRSSADCVAMTAARERGEIVPEGPPRPPSFTGPELCGGMRSSPGMVAFGGARLSGLASSLEATLGRVVQDHTGLTDLFDLQLSWNPELRAQTGGTAPGGLNTDRPSLVTAIQEQLGLKIEAQRAPVDVLVIDQASQLTPD